MQTNTNPAPLAKPLQEGVPVALGRLREMLAAHSPRALADSAELAHAAVAMILREGGGEAGTEILVIRRAEHPQDPWSGHMGFPGGRVDLEDASPEQTAIRETREELGIELDSCARLLGRLSELRARALAVLMPLSIYPFVYELVEPVVLRMNGEVVAAHWVPLRYFLEWENRGTMPHPRELGRTLPCYSIGDRVLWGLSLAMLDELLFEVLPGGKWAAIKADIVPGKSGGLIS